MASSMNSLIGTGLLVATAYIAGALDTASLPRSHCKVIPGDPGWPSTEKWVQLNDSVHGRLIGTIPLASVCHTDGIADYNETACESLQAGWDSPQTHFPWAGEIDSAWFQNQSCDPFTPASQPCELGNYVSYSINISDATDAATGIKFAKENNVRLVIKNTGHDYLGKSTGRGGLALWTHNLDSIAITANYTSSYYTGPAIKLGAGVIASEAYIAAAAAGYRVVGGTCPTVGIAGGYSQGGGHSLLSSKYGLGADNVLEWEVVTASGEHLVATPNTYEDLYWALSGGGGGTYGVVLSMTSRLHQDGQVGGGSLSFNDTATGNDVFWDAVGDWLATLPAYVDEGNAVLYQMTHSSFATASITAADQNGTRVAELLAPFLEKLDQHGIPYSFDTYTSPTFLDHFSHDLGPLPYGAFPASQLLNSRLVPQDTVTDADQNALVTQALRHVTESGHFYFGCHGASFRKPSTAVANAVLPAWRDSISHCIVVGDWDWTIPRSEMTTRETELMQDIMPPLIAATPGSGIYLNEGNFEQDNWQNEFYGENYASLKNIKEKYDPDGLFYATTAVGSEEWAVDGDGRLCQA